MTVERSDIPGRGKGTWEGVRPCNSKFCSGECLHVPSPDRVMGTEVPGVQLRGRLGTEEVPEGGGGMLFWILAAEFYAGRKCDCLNTA